MADKYLLVRSKTGQFIHLGHKGSMRSHCGVRAPIVYRGRTTVKRCCEKCFGPTPTNFNEYLAPGSAIE